MEPQTTEVVSQSVFQDPATLAALFRNACMLVALLAAGRIFWVGFKRRDEGQAWQLVMLGGLLATAAYIAIISIHGGPFGDSFFNITHAGPAGVGDYIFFLKGGILVAILGAFGLARSA